MLDNEDFHHLNEKNLPRQKGYKDTLVTPTYEEGEGASPGTLFTNYFQGRSVRSDDPYDP